MAGMDEDRRVLSLLKSKLPADPVIFDIGASNGSWGWNAIDIFPEASMFMFEPIWGISQVYDLGPLKALESLNQNERVKRLPIAVGDYDGQCTLHLMDDEVGSTTIEWDTDSNHSKPVSVATRRLDSLLASGEVTQPNLIKMDIQGGELSALIGAAKTLERVSALHLETWVTKAYGDHTPLLSDLINYLTPIGFRIFDFGTNFRYDDGTLYGIDVTFLKQDSTR